MTAPTFTRAAVFLAAVLSISSARRSLAQRISDDSLSRAVDAIMAHESSGSAPGCAVGVYENGRVALARGYGSANLEYGAPITPETPFIVGSVSKQFTATAIALLVQDGRISLDDDVRKYIPELPVYQKPITIDELVHHTSGLRDFWELVGASGLRFDDGYTVDDMMRMAARQRALNFTPGDKYMYSNTGYLVLGLVVKRVTGRSLRDFAAERIFGPLGMASSHFHDDHTMLTPGRARSYQKRGDAWVLADWNNDLVGQGGVMTTVSDLARWDENFYTGQVGGRELLARQLERGRLNDGTTLSYAFGLELGDYRGLPIVEHGGSTGGYRAEILRFPGAHTTVTALCNYNTARPDAIARRVADVALGATFTKPVPPARAQQAGSAQRPSVAMAPTDLARIAGTYYSPELDAQYRIELAGDSLRLRVRDHSPITLRPVGRDALVAEVGTLRFVGAPGSGFILDAGRIQGIVFERVR